MQLEFTNEELELLSQAVSFLKTNIEKAEDELDVSIDDDDVKLLEKKLYERSIKL